MGSCQISTYPTTILSGTWALSMQMNIHREQITHQDNKTIIGKRILMVAWGKELMGTNEVVVNQRTLHKYATSGWNTSYM